MVIILLVLLALKGQTVGITLTRRTSRLPRLDQYVRSGRLVSVKVYLFDLPNRAAGTLYAKLSKVPSMTGFLQPIPVGIKCVRRDPELYSQVEVNELQQYQSDMLNKPSD